jgi:serine/threonine protein kinase
VVKDSNLILGFLPFDSEFPEEIIKNIIDCKYEMTDDFWVEISSDAKDLINKLLMKNPDDRIDML